MGDGRLGYPEESPYNAIHVGAASESLPEKVCFALKKNILTVSIFQKHCFIYFETNKACFYRKNMMFIILF